MAAKTNRDLPVQEALATDATIATTANTGTGRMVVEEEEILHAEGMKDLFSIQEFLLFYYTDGFLGFLVVGFPRKQYFNICQPVRLPPALLRLC